MHMPPGRCLKVLQYSSARATACSSPQSPVIQYCSAVGEAAPPVLCLAPHEEPQQVLSMPAGPPAAGLAFSWQAVRAAQQRRQQLLCRVPGGPADVCCVGQDVGLPVALLPQLGSGLELLRQPGGRRPAGVAQGEQRGWAGWGWDVCRLLRSLATARHPGSHAMS
jgi:hypothetical protein